MNNQPLRHLNKMHVNTMRSM